MNYIFSYDITSDKLRNRLVKKLETNGCVRIQKSVFIGVNFNTKEVKLLKNIIEKELNSTLKEDSDSFLCLPITQTQKNEIWWLEPQPCPNFKLNNVAFL